MRKFEINAADFASIFVLMSEINRLFHTKRRHRDFIDFQSKYYKPIHDVYYSVISPYLSEEDLVEISRNDPFDDNRSIEDVTKYIETILTR